MGGKGGGSPQVVLLVVRWSRWRWRWDRLVAGCRDVGLSVFDRLGKSGGDVAVVWVVLVLVRVTVGDEGGWFVEVGVIGQCVVVCRDRAVGVEVVAVSAGACGVEIVAYRFGCCLDDGGHALFTDVAIDLVVDVGVAA